MSPTPRPRLRARPSLGIPMNMMNTTCGTLCWDFPVVCKLAYALSCHFALDLLCDKAEFHYRPVLGLATAASLPFWSSRLGHLV